MSVFAANGGRGRILIVNKILVMETQKHRDHNLQPGLSPDELVKAVLAVKTKTQIIKILDSVS